MRERILGTVVHESCVNEAIGEALGASGRDAEAGGGTGQDRAGGGKGGGVLSPHPPFTYSAGNTALALSKYDSLLTGVC